MIEEKQGSSTTASNVWSPAYVDALVARDTFDTTAAGVLDTSFNPGGTVPGTLKLNLGATDQIRALVTKDDKVLAVATSGSDMAFVRFNADGTLDNTFDGPGSPGNGKFLINLGGNDKVRAVAVQPDGNIVFAGETDVNGTIDVVIGRLTDTGAWDATFHTSGSFIDPITSGATDQAYGVGVDSQGHIVIAGDSGGDMLVARYTSAGNRDSTFGTSGILKTDFSGNDVAEGMAIDGQDRIVAAGYDNDGGSTDVVLERVKSDGTLDTTTFGTGGKVFTDFVGAADVAKQVAIDTAGRIVIGGRGGNGGAGVGSGQDMIVGRYTPAGVLDNTFGTFVTGTSGPRTGKQYVDFNSGGTDQAEDMAIDSAGRITLAGDTNAADFALARVNPSDGSLDNTFGDFVSGSSGPRTGTLKTSFTSGAGTTDAALAIAIRPDGRIIAAGYADSGTGKDLAVAQYYGGSNRYYALQDANFNTTAVVGGNGKVLERYVEDPYGSVFVLNPEWTSDADGKQDVDVPFLHQGLRWDGTSGLYYARNRDYSPALGRWGSQDPLSYINGMNNYASFGNDPEHRRDPQGTNYVNLLPLNVPLHSAPEGDILTLGVHFVLSSDGENLVVEAYINRAPDVRTMWNDFFNGHSHELEDGGRYFHNEESDTYLANMALVFNSELPGFDQDRGQRWGNRPTGRDDDNLDLIGVDQDGNRQVTHDWMPVGHTAITVPTMEQFESWDVAAQHQWDSLLVNDVKTKLLFPKTCATSGHIKLLINYEDDKYFDGVWGRYRIDWQNSGTRYTVSKTA